MLLGAMASTGAALPFWMTTGQYGLISDYTNSIAAVSAYSQFDTTKVFQYRLGGSLAATYNTLPGNTADFRMMVDQIYGSIRFSNVPLRLDLGMKHQPVDFNANGSIINGESTLGSLSTTKGHLVWSGNARSLPGYTITLEPWAIPFTKEHLWLYGAFGDYLTIDEARFARNALVHSTKAFLMVRITKRLDFHFGLDHYAVWGGHNDTHKLVNVSWANYWRVITGQKAGAEGSMSDRKNVIGDHGGGEMIKFAWHGNGFEIIAQHEIPYSDGSGMGFQNFPDGVNTIWFGWNDKDRWVSDIVYEYAYTMYQSGPIHIESYDEEGKPTMPDRSYTTGIDDYFNNGEYKDGWTYFGRTIGYPLFFPEKLCKDGYYPGVRNNRLKAHHAAVSGKFFRRFPYKLMLTYSRDYGTYYKPYKGESQMGKPWGTVQETPLRQFSASLIGEIPIIKGLCATYGLFADKGEVFDSQVGAQLGVRYELSRTRNK